MMKVNVTAPINDLDGKQIEQMTLRDAALAALVNTVRGDEALTGAKKAEFFGLAVRIHGEDEPDFKAEEIAMIKERIGKAYGPLVIGRAYALLDPVG